MKITDTSGTPSFAAPCEGWERTVFDTAPSLTDEQPTLQTVQVRLYSLLMRCSVASICSEKGGIFQCRMCTVSSSMRISLNSLKI